MVRLNPPLYRVFPSPRTLSVMAMERMLAVCRPGTTRLGLTDPTTVGSQRVNSKPLTVLRLDLPPDLLRTFRSTSVIGL